MSIVGTPEEVTQAYQDLVALGLTYFITAVLGNDLETLELMGTRVMPNVSRKEDVQRPSADEPGWSAAQVHPVDCPPARRSV